MSIGGKRIWKRYSADGDAGLAHRLRGRPSARCKPAKLRLRALALYAGERYADFGPTLMAEQLAKARLEGKGKAAIFSNALTVQIPEKTQCFSLRVE